MPQFDFVTYPGQIFWFAICFAALYYFMGNKILPRIRGIINERRNVIGNDHSAAKAFESRAEEFKIRTQKLLHEAEVKYRMAMENAAKEAAVLREKSLEEFKANADKMLQKSQAEIAVMVKNSQEKSQEVVTDLAKILQKKFS